MEIYALAIDRYQATWLRQGPLSETVGKDQTSALETAWLYAVVQMTWDYRSSWHGGREELVGAMCCRLYLAYAAQGLKLLQEESISSVH